MLKRFNRYGKGMLPVLTVLPLVCAAREGSCALLGDVLKPFVSVSETYDSNVFRVKDKEQLRALVGDDRLGDLITTVNLGSALHYALSHQELDLLLKRDMVRFSHYSGENSDRDEASGKLSLSLLERWKLKIDGGYTKAPEPRSDFRSAENNLMTTVHYGVAASTDLTLGLGLEVGYHRKEVDYSLPQFRANQYSADIFSGSASYRISPEAQLYARYQHEERSYREGVQVGGAALRRDNAADSIRVGANKSFSPRTAVSGYLGYLSRRHSAFPARDFSGMIGGAEISYGLTYKTALLMSGERQLYDETYPDRAYSINNAVGVGVVYQISEKMKSTIFERLTWKDYVAIPDSGAQKRGDFMQELSAGLEWTPIRRFTVNLDYRYSTRSSDDHSFDYSDHSITTGLGYRF